MKQLMLAVVTVGHNLGNAIAQIGWASFDDFLKDYKDELYGGVTIPLHRLLESGFSVDPAYLKGLTEEARIVEQLAYANKVRPTASVQQLLSEVASKLDEFYLTHNIRQLYTPQNFGKLYHLRDAMRDMKVEIPYLLQDSRKWMDYRSADRFIDNYCYAIMSDGITAGIKRDQDPSNIAIQIAADAANIAAMLVHRMRQLADNSTQLFMLKKRLEQEELARVARNEARKDARANSKQQRKR